MTAAMTETGAIVFTDIVGFTHFTLERGDEIAIALLERKEKLVRDALPDSGRVVKELGDGLLLWFEDACDALRTCVALQANFERESTEDLPLWVRMGLHWGCPRRRGDDIVGHDVNLAARIVELAGPGEVLVRGYNVMRGYFEQPEETAAAIDADGRLHTGDIGVMDERGYLRITDRKKDMFIVGGFNAYPAEIEGTIAAHPAVAQVAVVGVPDERLGEVGWAYVVLRAGESVDTDELVAWCRDQMANFKVPRHVEIVDALPMNATGKVTKFVLRERAGRRP